MDMAMKRIILIVIMLLMPLPLSALDVPQLGGRVNDYAGMLSPETKSRLEQKLSAFEHDQSTQIVVLTIPSLQGDNIDQFAIKVAENWKIGQKGKDNGVILILAQAERKVRIEVGRGLQGVLPDITAGQIIRNTMRPYLKEGNFDQGITVGVDAIIAATKGEFKASPTETKKQPQKKSSSLLTLLLLVSVAMLVVGSFSRQLGVATGAIGVPTAAWLAIPGLGLLAIILLAVAGLVAGLLLSALASRLFGGGGGGGGFFGGWGGGGGFYGGGSSGSNDSFSGGGGEFDGGGASDDY
jgi:uncharacterized protein